MLEEVSSIHNSGDVNQYGAAPSTTNTATWVGGGIFNDGTVNLDGGRKTENNATIDGGEIFNNYGSIVTGNLDLVKNNHPNDIVGPILDQLCCGWLFHHRVHLDLGSTNPSFFFLNTNKS